MDISSIRTNLKSKRISDIPLRVTFYARVSSDSDEQLNSLENQVQYYSSLIKSNENWTYVDGYIDEGISGISTLKRENFNRMIDDAQSGKFDLIITKEISRFARNTLDSITFTRKLLTAGVGVWFQNDGINTFDDDGELRLAIMSSIAQDELRKLSSRIKFGHSQAIKNNVVLGNSRIFGYNKNGGRLVVDEDEAPMVRELFELYSTNKYSMKQLETLFFERGIRNRNGNKIAHSTLSGIIANPKYKGYYVGNKVKVVDMFTKKQKFLPPEEWVMFKDETGDIVPAIVSEELWDAANAVLKRRSDDVKNRQGICNHANLLTGKIFCTECGSPYYRRESKNRNGTANSKWVCSGKINNGKDSCGSFAIYESEIKPILLNVFSDTQVNADAMIEEYLRIYRETIKNDKKTEKEIAACRKTIETETARKTKLLDHSINGRISDSDYAAQNKKCNEAIESANRRIVELEQLKDADVSFAKQLNDIRKTLIKAKADAANGIISKEFVDKYIDKILATPIDETTMSLEIRLFTGDCANRTIEKLAGRAGQMSKKMIEAYENGLK